MSEIPDGAYLSHEQQLRCGSVGLRCCGDVGLWGCSGPPQLTIRGTIGLAMDIRTIRKGRIKLGGQWWIPDERHMAYDGRLDNQRSRLRAHLDAYYAAHPKKEE